LSVGRQFPNGCAETLEAARLNPDIVRVVGKLDSDRRHRAWV